MTCCYINTQWRELPMSRTNFYGPKDVRAKKVRLYSWATGRISYGLKNEFESPTVNESSVFESFTILLYLIGRIMQPCCRCSILWRRCIVVWFFYEVKKSVYGLYLVGWPYTTCTNVGREASQWHQEEEQTNHDRNPICSVTHFPCFRCSCPPAPLWSDEYLGSRMHIKMQIVKGKTKMLPFEQRTLFYQVSSYAALQLAKLYTPFSSIYALSRIWIWKSNELKGNKNIMYTRSVDLIYWFLW